MRLAELLAELPSEQVEHLATEHLGDDPSITRAALYTTLEGVLRSYSFVRQFTVNRQPPTFSIFEILLDADGFSASLAGFREMAMERTRAICQAVEAGEMVGRDDSLRLYRRVFTEARRSELSLDPSETAILGVLRHELGIRLVEHYLLEHHSDLRQFWDTEHSFLTEMKALRSSGLVFAHDGRLVVAEEVVPLLRQSLGLELPSSARQRLYGLLSGADLNEILSQARLKTSGSKEEKLNRLILNRIQPSEALQALSLATLREIARSTDAQISGSKDELVERLTSHFLHGRDQRVAAEVPPALPPEPRVLDERRFRALFWSLKGEELTDILANIDSSRRTGAKETKVSVLWQTRHSEETLLGGLTNRCIEDVLVRHRLKVSGSKRERVGRLLEYFSHVPEALLPKDALDDGRTMTEGEREPIGSPGSGDVV